MRQPHPTPHKNRIIPIFCAVSDAAVASDTVKITVRVNTPLDGNFSPIGIRSFIRFHRIRPCGEARGQILPRWEEPEIGFSQ
jgi:hypothetical protein